MYPSGELAPRLYWNCVCRFASEFLHRSSVSLIDGRPSQNVSTCTRRASKDSSTWPPSSRTEAGQFGGSQSSHTGQWFAPLMSSRQWIFSRQRCSGRVTPADFVIGSLQRAHTLPTAPGLHKFSTCNSASVMDDYEAGIIHIIRFTKLICPVGTDILPLPSSGPACATRGYISLVRSPSPTGV